MPYGCGGLDMSGRGTEVGAEDEAEDEPDDGGFRISIKDMALPVGADPLLL